MIEQLIDYVLHVDKHLLVFAQNYGTLIYVLLFAIVFCETGLIVTPFLPGDSLLFAVGALAPQGMVLGNPLGDQLRARGGDVEAVIAATLAALHERFGTEPMVLSLQEIVFVARKGAVARV